MVRRQHGALAFLLVHHGGPYHQDKDEGDWTIPKGLVEAGEELLDAARREFEEETGVPVDSSDHVPLGMIRQKGGKIVHAWAFLGDCDPAAVRSNTFVMEWPPRSGRMQSFPEIDRAGFFDADTARRKINPAQVPFIDRAVAALS